MEPAVAILLVSLVLWTGAVAGAAWYARGRIASAEEALRDDTIADQHDELEHLEELLESAAKGEAQGREHLRRRLAAASVTDPSERRRLLYPERSGDPLRAGPAT